MRRREFVLGGLTAAACPISARAQQPVLPVIGFLRVGSPDASTQYVAAFRKGLNETGTIEGRNVKVEYHWLDGQYDQLPALMADLVRRKVAVIATLGSIPAALAAKATTSAIPIIFGTTQDPVQLGLVASLARPGGNVAGINFFNSELTAKRLRLLHDLLLKAVRVAVLVTPANSSTAQFRLQDVQKAPPTIGLQMQVLNASTIGEINVVFATPVHDRPDALFVAANSFFTSRRMQFATLTLVKRIPAVYSNRDPVDDGGLMTYGVDLADAFHQVGLYTGRILNGKKPADLPVLQSTKFEFVINLQTGRALGIKGPLGPLAIVDEVIE